MLTVNWSIYRCLFNKMFNSQWFYNLIYLHNSLLSFCYHSVLPTTDRFTFKYLETYMVAFPRNINCQQRLQTLSAIFKVTKPFWKSFFSLTLSSPLLRPSCAIIRIGRWSSYIILAFLTVILGSRIFKTSNISSHSSFFLFHWASERSFERVWKHGSIKLN